jgi:hypothetical protein
LIAGEETPWLYLAAKRRLRRAEANIAWKSHRRTILGPASATTDPPAVT